MDPDNSTTQLDAIVRLRARIEGGLASGPGRAAKPEDAAVLDRMATVTDWIALGCPTCGRLHCPMPMEQAQAEVAACPGDSVNEYLRCRGCGTQSSEFLGVTQENIESRPGSTHVLHACVVNRPPAAGWDDVFSNSAVAPPTFLADGNDDDTDEDLPR